MRFLDVDDVEVDAVAVLAIQLFQPARLVAEGWSGIGAEDEGDGSPSQIAQRRSFAVSVEDGKVEVRRLVTDVRRKLIAAHH